MPLKKRQYASLQRRKKDARKQADVAQEEKSHSSQRRLSDVVAGACRCRVGQYTGESIVFGLMESNVRKLYLVDEFDRVYKYLPVSYTHLTLPTIYSV